LTWVSFLDSTLFISIWCSNWFLAESTSMGRRWFSPIRKSISPLVAIMSPSAVAMSRAAYFKVSSGESGIFAFKLSSSSW
jgi:hypothetical protein